jgi:hypothetical protein
MVPYIGEEKVFGDEDGKQQLLHTTDIVATMTYLEIFIIC